ncbi:apolipoprotein N-acyltransferase [Streptosporangiaceae bacterium NEAU-GS5]|nr:apolipoprotein N-acyltransferase [Streptosporangiaceae bacterium NEAU-GS5]
MKQKDPHQEPRQEAAAGWPGALAARLPVRVGCAAVGGLLLFLAFPPIGWWWSAPAGVALFTIAVYGAPGGPVPGVRPRRAAWLGCLAGAAFLFPALSWVRPIGDDAWLALVGVSSLFYAALGALAALVVRLRLWPLWAACLWVLIEWARGLFPVGGFPWARLAFSQGQSAYTKWASLGGAPLVTFMVALSGTLVAYAATAAASGRLRAPGRGRMTIQAVALGALAAPLAGLAIPLPGDEGRAVNVGVVQGNVPGRGMDFLGDEPAVVLRNHAGETHKLAEAIRAGRFPRPDLVVWPENSTDIDPYQSPDAYRIIDSAVKDVGVPVLVGAVVAIGDENRATRAIVWDPVSGPGAYYDKRKLVPFGEYTPYKEIFLKLSSRANLVGRQSVPGTRVGTLRLGPVTVGAVECYEVAFDSTVRDTVTAGGTPLVVQANNASYALTGLPPQQLAMDQLRAVEHNRAVVTAAPTGISASIDPTGAIQWRTAELVQDMTVVRVSVRTHDTIATRVGPLPEWMLIFAGAGAVAAAFWRRRASRQAQGKTSEDTPDETPEVGSRS